MSKSKPNTNRKPINKTDLARIQSAVAKKNDGQVPKDSYVGRMQEAAERNTIDSNDQ
ncbi:hypothetical protein [Denitromonas ohlonensis]|uniref:Uncharacterized protein n=2 Tax=Denitromonas TaxID=139331 RepID=A0A558DZU6_9RHOO|nr:hypothetical protein [Denitromonas ohlonensis]TVT46748.1 MAG: hypothetical protein FHP94_16085 [Denitromonas halophila]TVO64212.1 hypothetical protein FHP90_12990 [Denitromonas ohlonensis]TVO76113.1 hypothetical protein FHP89_11665 [Denitromonas ohlonensis]TVT66363.1 MAG: hypothetical protein FHP93_19070 [Denitromonas halophila]TVT77500.1 MAG: hypothetical protein FHP92_04845 [Denitromonas halophila]